MAVFPWLLYLFQTLPLHVPSTFLKLVDRIFREFLWAYKLPYSVFQGYRIPPHACPKKKDVLHFRMHLLYVLPRMPSDESSRLVQTQQDKILGGTGAGGIGDLFPGPALVFPPNGQHKTTPPGVMGTVPNHASVENSSVPTGPIGKAVYSVV